MGSLSLQICCHCNLGLNLISRRWDLSLGRLIPDNQHAWAGGRAPGDEGLRKKSFHPIRSKIYGPRSVDLILGCYKSLPPTVFDELLNILRGERDQHVPKEGPLRLGIA